MLNIVIFGAPGSGKGTQSQSLADKYGLKHISTGELLREEIKRGTDIGKLADTYISQGHLVPDEMIIDILERLLENYRNGKGFIFDGFPRTISQGEALNKMLLEHGEKVDVVISLEVDEEELIQRLLKRGEISGRTDDNRETIESRLDVYYRQTAPLKEFYAKQGVLREIQGRGSIEEIFHSIEKEVDRL